MALEALSIWDLIVGRVVDTAFVWCAYKIVRFLYFWLFGSNELQNESSSETVVIDGIVYPNYSPKFFVGKLLFVKINGKVYQVIGSLSKIQGLIPLIHRNVNRARISGTIKNYEDFMSPTFERKIYVVDSVSKCEAMMSELKAAYRYHGGADDPVFGFDCEWSPYGHCRPVALLQISQYWGDPGRNFCFLIRLCKMDEFPKILKEILENRNLIKVGVAPYTDARKLYEDYGVRVAGTLDLRYMAHMAGHRAGGLAKMCEDCLDYSLDKNDQLSDWEETYLTKNQIKYAADDAQASVELFKFFAKKIAVDKCAKYIIDKHCSQYIDQTYGPEKFLTLKELPPSIAPTVFFHETNYFDRKENTMKRGMFPHIKCYCAGCNKKRIIF